MIKKVKWNFFFVERGLKFWIFNLIKEKFLCKWMNEIVLF